MPAAGAALAVVVAGEIAGDIAAVAGVIPAAGEIAAAGVVTVAGATGCAPAGLAGEVPGGSWANEVNATVEQRLAISSVFIGLIGKFLSRLRLR